MLNKLFNLHLTWRNINITLIVRHYVQLKNNKKQQKK